MAPKRWPGAGGAQPRLGLSPALLVLVSWGLPAVAAEHQVIVEEFTNNT